jgi:hypothetical protein
MDHQEKIEGFVRAIKKSKTFGETESFQEHLLRERVEYENAKLIIKKYEVSDTAALIEACEKILKEK